MRRVFVYLIEKENNVRQFVKIKVHKTYALQKRGLNASP